jgi:hypothetical protein
VAQSRTTELLMLADLIPNSAPRKHIGNDFRNQAGCC